MSRPAEPAYSTSKVMHDSNRLNSDSRAMDRGRLGDESARDRDYKDKRHHDGEKSIKVPESGTWGMLLISAAVLTLVIWRRRLRPQRA